MTPLKQRTSTDTTSNKKVMILNSKSPKRNVDCCNSINTFFLLKMVSVDICCFRRVILSPYNCSWTSMEVFNINFCCFITIFGVSWSRISATSVTVYIIAIRYHDWLVVAALVLLPIVLHIQSTSEPNFNS